MRPLSANKMTLRDASPTRQARFRGGRGATPLFGSALLLGACHAAPLGIDDGVTDGSASSCDPGPPIDSGSGPPDAREPTGCHVRVTSSLGEQSESTCLFVGAFSWVSDNKV